MQLLSLQCLRRLPGVSAVMRERLSCLGRPPARSLRQACWSADMCSCRACGLAVLHLHSSLRGCHPCADDLLKLSIHVTQRT